MIKHYKILNTEQFWSKYIRIKRIVKTTIICVSLENKFVDKDDIMLYVSESLK